MSSISVLSTVLLSWILPLSAAGTLPGKSSCTQHLTADFTPAMSDWVLLAQDPSTLPATMDEMEAEFTRRLEEIKSISPAERTFQNTVRATDAALDAILSKGIAIKTISSLRPSNKKTTRFVNEFNVRHSSVLARFGTDAELYQALLETPTAPGLQSELKQALLGRLKDSGATRSPETRERVALLVEEMASLSSAFTQSMQNDTSSVTLSLEELVGVDPELYKENIKDGAVAFPVSAPELVTKVLTQSPLEETRKKIYLAYRGRNPENLERLTRITQLNAEIARLLGEPSYLHAVISDQTLIGGPENARRLLEDLALGFKTAFRARIQEIERLKRQDGLTTPVQYWDFYHYENRLTPPTAQAIAKEALEYFPTRTFNEIFFGELTHLFKISFTEVKDQPVWHKSVKLYQVKSTVTGKTLGYLYMDNYSRRGKNSSTAFVEEMIARRTVDGVERVPVVAFVTNWGSFAKRNSLLLDLDNVITNLHEMGHALHAIFQEGQTVSLSGFSFPSDKMEVPSTTLESFFKDPEMIRALSARHGDPNQKMSIELATKVADSISGFKFLGGDFHSSSHEMNTVFLSLLDMKIQNRVDEIQTGEDILAIYREMFKEYFGFAPHPEDHFPQNFHHIAGEYAGFYSSYIIARVGAANNLMRFKELGGSSNPDVMDRWRREDLSRPNSLKKAIEISEGFWGHAMSVSPVFQELGF